MSAGDSEGAGTGGAAMMAAGPVLGIAGFAAFGPMGFAAGWMIGSWLYNRSQQKGNEIFDPGAQEMPRFNNALRGQTMPVLFGTNRVSAQIVYQANYTTIRKENQEGGGGKGGGSGGMKGAAATGSITYEYKWDLIYHLGMVPTAYDLYGGWLGSDRLNDSTILSIYSDSPLLSSGSITEQADLTFDDSFYSTGDPERTEWSYWAENNLSGLRWPRTVWVGFDQLFLGNRPSVPQLSFEIGPAGAALTFDSNLYWYTSTNLSLTDGDFSSLPIIKGTDGNYYALDLINGGSTVGSTVLNIYGTTNDTAVGTLTSSTVWTDIVNDIGAQDSDIETGHSGVHGCVGAFRCTDTDTYYILIVSENFTNNPDGNAYYSLYTWSGSALTYVGSACYGITSTNTPRPGLADIKTVDVWGAKTTGDPIILLHRKDSGGSGQYDPFLTILGSVNEFIAGTDVVPNGTTSNELALRTTNLNTNSADDLSNLFAPASYRTTNFTTRPCLLPTTSDGLTYKSTMFQYISAAALQYHLDNPSLAASVSGCPWIEATAGTYPNGALLFLALDVNTLTHRWTTAPTISGTNQIDNSKFTYDGVAAVPFYDVAETASGAADTTHTHDYNQASNPFQLASGLTLILMTRVFNDEVDTTPVGTNHKIAAFVWNPLLQTAQRYIQGNGVPYDPVAEGISSEANRYNYKQSRLWLMYDETTNKLIYLDNTDTGAGSWNGTDKSFFGEYGTLALAGGSDVTPPYIIYTILTDPIFGINFETTDIDATSYAAAIAYCETEEILVSVQYRREASALQIIEELLSVYGGYLVFSSGKVKFGLVREDSGDHTGRTVDNHHLISDGQGQPPVDIVEGAKQDTFNKVRVNYYDRSLDYQQNQIEEHDEVDQDLYGVRMREYPLRFVMSQQTARKMALRTLWTNLYERDTYAFQVGWKDADLEPGDVITLVDSYHTILQGGKNVRIVEWKENGPGKFLVTAREELGYATTAVSSYSTVSSGQFTSKLGPTPNIKYTTAYELPCEFQLLDQGRVYVGWAADAFAAGAEIHISADDTTYALAKTVEPYPIAGTLLTNLDAGPEMDENVDVVLFPASGYTTNSPIFTQTGDIMNAAGPGTRSIGGSLIWIGSEMLAYENVTLIGTQRYRLGKVYRGWGGTHIHAHNSGDNWTRHGAGIYSQAYTENYIGTTMYVKVRPYNLQGNKLDLSSITAVQHTILGSHYRPQVPSALNYVVGSTETGAITKLQHSGGSIEIDWRDSAKKAGYGNGGYGAGGYGDFTADVASHWWLVNVVGSGDVVVRSVIASSAHYSYSSGDNFTDNGAWRGNVAFVVDHKNAYGSAPRTSVISMELFL